MHKPHDLYTPTELLFLSLPPEQLIWWVGFSPTDIDTLLGVPEGAKKAQSFAKDYTKLYEKKMNLPENIKEQILDYLHLEFAEDPSNPLSLKLENIEFDWVFEIYGKPIHYYKFGRKNWATVEPIW